MRCRLSVVDSLSISPKKTFVSVQVHVRSVEESYGILRKDRADLG